MRPKTRRRKAAGLVTAAGCIIAALLFMASTTSSTTDHGIVAIRAAAGAADVEHCLAAVPANVASVAELWNGCLALATKPKLVLPLSLTRPRDAAAEADIDAATAALDRVPAVQRRSAVVVDVKAARELGGFDTNLRPSSAGLVADLALRHATAKAAAPLDAAGVDAVFAAVAAAAGVPASDIRRRGWEAVLQLEGGLVAEPNPRDFDNPARAAKTMEVAPPVGALGQAVLLGLPKPLLLDRQGRCNAAWYLRTKWRPGRGPGAALVGLGHLRPWAPYGGALVTGAPEIAGAAVPDAAQQRRFRDCVDTGAGLRLVVGDRREHCLMPTPDETALQSPAPGQTSRVSKPLKGWVDRAAARLSVLLRIGQAYPWRNDRVPSYLLPLTPFDAGLLEYHVVTIDVPLGCASVLLNMPGTDALKADLVRLATVLQRQGLRFRYQHHPENLGVAGAWNRLSRYAIAEMHRGDAERAGPAALKEATALADAENVTADGPEFAAVQAAVLRVRGEAYREGFVWLTQPDTFIRPSWYAHSRRFALRMRRDEAYVTLSHHASMFVPVRTLLDTVGLYDENVFPSYGEDVEYWLRMRAAGLVKTETMPAAKWTHLKSSTKKASSAIRTMSNLRWRRHQYMLRKWGFHISRLKSDPEGKDKSQFRHPWNSVLIALNESWRVVDHEHIECIKSGVGPGYEGKAAACEQSCLFDMRKVEIVWPKAFARENLARTDFAIAARFPTNRCL